MNTSPTADFMKKFVKGGKVSTKDKAKAVGGGSRLAKAMKDKKK